MDFNYSAIEEYIKARNDINRFEELGNIKKDILKQLYKLKSAEDEVRIFIRDADLAIRLRIDVGIGPNEENGIIPELFNSLMEPIINEDERVWLVEHIKNKDSISKEDDRVMIYYEECDNDNDDNTYYYDGKVYEDKYEHNNWEEELAEYLYNLVKKHSNK